MKYTKAMIEAIELKAEDVVLTSGGTCASDCSADCSSERPADCPREIW